MSCRTKTRDSKIVFQDGEGKCKMNFNNPRRQEIEKVIVDDCLITDGKRCDFLLIHNSIEHFIELKGKKIAYACIQLEETIKRISKSADLKYSFVVSTACPLTTTEIQILKRKFREKYNCILLVKSNYCDHTLL